MRDPSTGWRMLACYPTWEEGSRCLASLGANARHVNEIICHGSPCKGYLDIDADALPPCFTTVDDVVAAVVALVHRVYAEDYRITLPDDACVVLHSPMQSKISLHVTISTHSPQYVFRSNHQDDPQGAAHLAHRIRQLLPEGAGSVIDTAVYTKDREMRCCGSSKYEKRHSVLEVFCGGDKPCGFAMPHPNAIITWLDPPEQRATISVPVQLPRAVRERRAVCHPSDLRRSRADPGHEDIVAGRMLELLRDKVHPSAVLRMRTTPASG
jgi:hypothetical protein